MTWRESRGTDSVQTWSKFTNSSHLEDMVWMDFLLLLYLPELCFLGVLGSSHLDNIAASCYLVHGLFEEQIYF